ncbi:MAG: hypothetical protein H6551_11545 [Chitinophagales bacterium]|nr:hypothetical protein [Chitinophagaceae bacterium]MCB9065761.1 hypothetical protein [Chitinophagales bacterium]
MQIPLSKVEVYKTNVEDNDEAAALAASLLQYHPDADISFDLEDCDKVMRVIGNIPAHYIIKHMEDCGYDCAVME